MNEWISSPEFEDSIRQSFGVPQIRNEFVNHLYTDIMHRADPKAQKTPVLSKLRPAYTISLVIIVIFIATIMAIGPKRAYAEVISFFGYMPDVGLVEMDKIRVLKNAVTQQHQGRELTVIRGLANEQGTNLWLEFNDEARPINDAWLETPDGLRLEIIDWNYTPDQPGTRGVAAHFPPLSLDTNEMIFALTEGWRIPLTWITGSQSNLTPANVIVAPTYTSEEATTSSPVIENTPQSPLLCSQAMEISFCVQAAARTPDNMEVLLEAIPSGRFTTGSMISPSMFDIPDEATNLTLSDINGNHFTANPNLIQVGGEPSGGLTTLHFPGAQELKGRINLNIPALLVTIQLSEEVSVDLGENPEAGQEFLIDQTIDVAGFPVHFSKAVLEGGRKNSLNLKITSDLLDDTAPIRPYLLEPGKPEGIDDQYGAGSGPNQLSLQVQLIQQTGLRTGNLRIPIISAALKVRGPFILSFDVPQESPSARETPQLIENGTFEPSKNSEPLPMYDYQYTGVGLTSGDLLSMVYEDGITVLSKASPNLDFSPQKLAVLPGQVIEIFPHPDKQGIDYITGEINEATSAIVFRQLYTLRFDDRAPHLLLGKFESNGSNFEWSFDGRFLAYLSTSDQPGQKYHQVLHLVDLSCRQTGNCRSTTIDAGNQELYQINWSPNDYRIATGGLAGETDFGMSDIFLLTLKKDGTTDSLQNLTQSPTIADWLPAHWTSSGDGLRYICATGETALNEYSLCGSDLSDGEDKVIVPLLPWNMNAIHLSNDNQLIDRMPVWINGIYSLRIYDLATSKTNILLEWTDRDKYWVETFVSPNGRWLATVIDKLGGLLVLDIETHKTKLVLPSGQKPRVATWVK